MKEKDSHFWVKDVVTRLPIDLLPNTPTWSALLDAITQLKTERNNAIAIAEKPESAMNISTAIDDVKKFFEGEYFSITDTAALSEIDTDRMQKQDGDDCKPFDHCFVDQNGGGLTGDDFHGVVYFHIGENKYLVVDY